MSTPTDLYALWRDIADAGSIDTYVDAQLRERGFLVERQDTDGMSKRQLERYKKQLKREAAEKRALKKQGWLAYKANHIVHLGEGVFWNEASDADLWDLPEPDARLAENELPRIDSPQQLADALGLSISELRWLTVHRDAAKSIHYKRFEIPKKSGGTREIWAPMPKLKAAQRWILDHIVERLPVHGAVHGFMPGRGIVSNAKAHTDCRLIVNLDLKSFFPSVNWKRVRGVFRKAGYREQVATLLAMLCTEAPRKEVQWKGERWFIALGPRCLPQGAPTSPALTNTLCLKMDRRLSGLARKLGYSYTRYADDLSFGLPRGKTPPRTGALIGSVKRIVIAEGFVLNPDKTRVARSGGRQQVTGLVVNGPGAPRVPRRLRRQLRAAVHNLQSGKPLREGESLASLTGYAAFVYSTDPELGAHLLKAISALHSEPPQSA